VKPSPFTHHAPTSVREALDVLAEVGPGGKVLAGGQSLVPMLNMRLAAPAHLVDVNRLGELAFVRAESGGVRVGALARHVDVERSDEAYAVQPLLRRALRLVAHPTIRNRGTTVGSLVHADPSGEMTAVLALLDGEVEIARADGTRTVAAADFFRGPLESAVGPGDLAVSAWFPAQPPRTGSAFVEVARRHGDYAVCGVAATVTLATDGRVAAARAAYRSMGPVPTVLDLTGAAGGAPVAEADWAGAGRAAADRSEPEGDIHATADYRRHLADVLTVRALREAAGRAAEAAGSADSTVSA
jgi:carbon-monoxide dehydrogenase medium subunit